VTTIGARAPGKLFLTGEYAVLCGAPALVAAVDCHAEVRLRLAAGRGSIAVESLADAARCATDHPETEEITGGDVGAVLAALRVARAWRPALGAMHADVTVDSRAFLDDGKKLGVGRSAATVTAAVAAFLAGAGAPDPAVVFEAAVAAHALLQDGHGSGADIAASAHGGVIEFRRSAGRLSVAARRMPPGLHLVVGWTGVSVPTDPLLKRFASTAAAREPSSLGPLRAVAERAAAAAAEAQAPSFLDAVRETADLLARLGEESGIPIVTAPVTRLIEAARRAGAVAKSSGAGGGDCGVAFATSPEQADAVRSAWREVGIRPLSLGITAAGASVAPGGEVSVG
jgi:phosphomevalonate kinase